MSEPVHCPYLGLRQNRAIRFAAPTPEHRCYREGTPIEIPVDQRVYCLTAEHRTCPLYTGQWDASRQGTSSGPIPPKNGARRAAPAANARSTVPSSVSRTARRNRLIYFAVVALVGLLTLFWGTALYRSAWWSEGSLPPSQGDPSPTFSLPVVVPPVGATPTTTPTASPSAVPRATETLTPTVTVTPTSSPTASPTSAPTFPPIPTVTFGVILPEPTFAPPSSTPPTEDTVLPPAPTEALPAPTVASSPLPTAAPTVELPTEQPPTTEPTTVPVPTETTAPPAPREPTATIVLQLTVLPLQRP